MVEPFTVHRGRAVVIRRHDVDTDQILPARFCKRVTKTGYGDALFAEWRKEPGFVLNNPRYTGASILIAGRNFGIGSSREHAVWALRDYGFKVIVSAAFGEIFNGNALKNGLLPIVLPETVIGGLADQAPTGLEIVVDLELCLVTWGGGNCGFEIDERARHMLLNGEDEIALTILSESAIRRYETEMDPWLPSLAPPRH